MKRLLPSLTALILSVFAIYPSDAQRPDPINIVTTAVPFLRISPDARAGGMGDLGIATSPDPSSSFYNLAKTPFAAHPTGVGVTYTPWLKDLGLNDVYLLAASGYHKFGNDDQAISASIRYFSLGNIEFTGPNGQTLGVGRPREMGFDVGYSRKLSSQLALGIGLRFINSDLKLAGYTSGTTYKAGNAVAADVSLFYTGVAANGQGWNFGVALSNLGTKIGYTNDATAKEYIPANFGIGATYTKVFNEQNKVSFGLDLNKLLVPLAPISVDGAGPRDSANLASYHNKSVVSSWFNSFSAPGGFSEELRQIQASIGLEYTYDNQFSVRAGYYYEDKNEGDRKYVTFGVGVRYNVVGLNFSYLVPSGSGVTRNPLSNTIRFGLIFDIDNAK